MNPEICTVCSSGTVQYICYMVTVPVFFVCVCVWNRLPEADDGGREHHRLNVPLPVATRVRPHSARLPPPLPGRTCAVSHGPPLQWTGWPHQARTATGGTHTLILLYFNILFIAKEWRNNWNGCELLLNSCVKVVERGVSSTVDLPSFIYPTCKNKEYLFLCTVLLVFLLLISSLSLFLSVQKDVQDFSGSITP